MSCSEVKASAAPKTMCPALWMTTSRRPVFLDDHLDGLVGRFLRGHIQLNRAKVHEVFYGELFHSLHLRSVSACRFAHAGVNGVSSQGKRARREGAKAAGSSSNEDDALHMDLPVLRVMGMKRMVSDYVCFSSEAAVCAKHLRVDPSAVGPGKKGDDVCDIVGLTEPLKGRHAADLFDLLFSLAVQEELRPHGARCDGV